MVDTTTMAKVMEEERKRKKKIREMRGRKTSNHNIITDGSRPSIITDDFFFVSNY